MSGGFSAMQNSLSQPTVFGVGYDAAPAGLIYGGGGGGLWNRLWIGGKGFGMYVATASTDRGTSTLTGGGGGGELGYAVIANHEWIVVPFFGLGGLGYGLKVKNSSPVGLTVYPRETIPSGGEQTYTAGFFTGELGLRATRLLFSGGGGFTVGAELGYMSSLQRAAWASASGSSSPESAELRGAYFRVLIGGGSLSFREKHETSD